MAVYDYEMMSIHFLLMTYVSSMHSDHFYCHDYQGLGTDEQNRLFHEKSFR